MLFDYKVDVCLTWTTNTAIIAKLAANTRTCKQQLHTHNKKKLVMSICHSQLHYTVESVPD